MIGGEAVEGGDAIECRRRVPLHRHRPNFVALVRLCRRRGERADAPRIVIQASGGFWPVYTPQIARTYRNSPLRLHVGIVVTSSSDGCSVKNMLLTCECSGGAENDGVRPHDE